MTASDEFDAALHNAARITIVSRLMVHRRMRFHVLRDATALSPGNLSSHLQVLEKAGYVRQRDAFVALRPARVVEITDAGDRAVRSYVNALRQLVERLQPAPGTGAKEMREVAPSA